LLAGVTLHFGRQRRQSPTAFFRPGCRFCGLRCNKGEKTSPDKHQMQGTCASGRGFPPGAEAARFSGGVRMGVRLAHEAEALYCHAQATCHCPHFPLI
jgi:hypothetical protein